MSGIPRRPGRSPGWVTPLPVHRALACFVGWVLATGTATADPFAQSLTGTSGLITIPTAEMPADGSLTFGANLIDRRYHGYAIPGFDRHSALVEFATIGFLPFVEVDLRLTRATGVPRQALGDRMVSARARVMKEGERRPSIAVGAHDLLGTHFFHSIYAVASKTAQPLAGIGRVGVHLGYGGNLLSLKVEGVQFDGVFGGVSVAPRPWVTMMAEYDAERVNAGVRLRAGRFALLLAAQHLDGISGGVSYSHPLN